MTDVKIQITCRCEDCRGNCGAIGDCQACAGTGRVHREITLEELAELLGAAGLLRCLAFKIKRARLLVTGPKTRGS